MFTFFSCPKKFDGDFATIQMNALRSWRRLSPQIEILLFGNEAGVAEAAREVHGLHIPEVARNHLGTPMLDDIFAKAEAAASYNLLCYLNADILLPDVFASSIKTIASVHSRFLAIGQCLDMHILSSLGFDDYWHEQLLENFGESAQLRASCAMDFFCFTKGLFGRLPPLVLGRVGWDNWMVYQARLRKIPVIDITSTCTIIHQHHDYSHVPYDPLRGEEARSNRQIAGDYGLLFGCDQSTLCLDGKSLRPFIGMFH